MSIMQFILEYGILIALGLLLALYEWKEYYLDKRYSVLPMSRDTSFDEHVKSSGESPLTPEPVNALTMNEEIGADSGTFSTRLLSQIESR
jgi:hypothetical protein